jgi:two-component system, NtrC family, sensor kinase
MTLLPNTIRGWIATAFLSCFVFMGIIIALNYNNFRSLSRSIRYFEIAEELNKNLLEMRRNEKNYFLYRQEFNYEENISYANQLALTLRREHSSLVEAIGQSNYSNFIEYVKDYAGLMARMHESSCQSRNCASLQDQIRGVGQNLMLLADQLVTTERRTINRLLQHMIPLPLISLIFLVILLGFVIFYIGEKVIRPLARITRESEAVAQGAFQRITPYGGDKNEIHQLVSAINRMMTELEKRQEQLIQSRKIASLGTLTAGIAHEINNPINNLSLTLEALIEDDEHMDNQERQQLFQEAMDQADHTSEIVKNLLEFTRATHPKVEYIDLEELIDKTARLVNNEMNLSNIRFVKEVYGALPRVRLDKGGLQQVLLNLFINSLQIMGKDGELKVIVGPADNSGEVRIDVIDSGPGIPAEILGQVFDPFFTTKKEGEGTGLGLSVSYTIIEKNGGRMEVKNQPDQGACFSIFLPTNNGE